MIAEAIESFAPLMGACKASHVRHIGQKNDDFWAVARSSANHIVPLMTRTSHFGENTVS